MSAAISAAKKPNIAYILADDMGVGDVACLNPKVKVKTPNLDGLAAKGMIFNDAHTSSAVCTPTRYGLMTGRYNWRSELKAYPWFTLYNLQSDPAETNNLYTKFPHIVDRLTALMTRYIENGRSTPGTKQTNTGATPFLPKGFKDLSSGLRRQATREVKVDGIK